MGISIWQLLIVLLIVVLLFGTKKLRNMGGDLGAAIKSFRSAVKDGGDKASQDGDGEDKDTDPQRLEQDAPGSTTVIDGEVASKESRDRA